jgi:hypothetical protein
MEVVQCNDHQERNTATGCDICGHGFTPDQRMSFQGATTASLTKAAYLRLTALQLELGSVECILAKLMEIQKGEVAGTC